MMKITREIWNKTHRDYKGKRSDGTRTIVHMDYPRGATVLAPVELVDHVEPEDCQHPKRTLEHGDGDGDDAFKVVCRCDVCGAQGEPAWESRDAIASLFETHPPATEEA